MTLDYAFETAMVYAMNTYAREVLLPAGLLAPHAMDAIGSEAILREKYVIARGEAPKWAALVAERGLRPAQDTPNQALQQQTAGTNRFVKFHRLSGLRRR